MREAIEETLDGTRLPQGRPARTDRDLGPRLQSGRPGGRERHKQIAI